MREFCPIWSVGSNMKHFILCYCISLSIYSAFYPLETIKFALMPAVPNLLIKASACCDDGTLIKKLSSSLIIIYTFLEIQTW